MKHFIPIVALGVLGACTLKAYYDDPVAAQNSIKCEVDEFKKLLHATCLILQ